MDYVALNIDRIHIILYIIDYLHQGYTFAATYMWFNVGYFQHTYPNNAQKCMSRFTSSILQQQARLNYHKIMCLFLLFLFFVVYIILNIIKTNNISQKGNNNISLENRIDDLNKQIFLLSAWIHARYICIIVPDVK